MVKWLGHPLYLLLLVSVAASSDLQTGLGMRQKRPLNEPEDHRQMVTIDLSALRPSLPGLVLYNYGDQAPKLVQVDLSALNPQLQPHVIWPQFDQMDLFNDRSLEFDDIDSIPYLTDDESLISSSKPLMAKMAMSSKEEESWPEEEATNRGVTYDFIPDLRKNSDMKTLQGRLPIADEVIVPLDWEEEKTIRNSAKRAGFLPRGWRRFGDLRGSETPNGSSHTSSTANAGHQTNPSQTNLIAGKREHHWETEFEDKDENQSGKKNVLVARSWSPSKQQITAMAAARRWGNRRKAGSNNQQQMSPSRTTWAVPQAYWTVPNLLGGGWQYMEHK